MRETSERLLALLRGQRVDRPPLWEVWFGMWEMFEARYDADWTAMADDLGHAARPLPSANVDGFVETSHRTEAGAYYAGGSLRRYEQLEALPEPDWDDAREQTWRAAREAHQAGHASWMILGWCFDRLSAWMGLEAFAMACYDEPQFVHDAMAFIERANRRMLEELIEPAPADARPDFLLYNGDCAYKTGPMLAPDMIRDFCNGPTITTVEHVRSLDLPLTFHTDGRLDEVMPLLLDFGVSAVHGCEKQANDLGHLVETFGDRTALCGNMDVVFLSRATPAEVEAETRKMLDIGSAKGRFLAACNTSPQDYIPIDNYVAMCRTIDAYPG